jgi:hypothetical protein
MKVKEKANELVALFEYEDNLGIAENTGIEGIDKNQAIECALIAVSEIMEVLWHSHDENNLIIWNYYKEVKQEIEKNKLKWKYD